MYHFLPLLSNIVTEFLQARFPLESTRERIAAILLGSRKIEKFVKKIRAAK